MTTTATHSASNAYATLLARYVAGDIADEAMDTFCSAMDDADLSGSERLAMARFYLDAVAAGETEHILPRAEEMADVLQIARA